MPKSKRSKAPEVNASSMADIAFLLLAFFLVTTKIEVDTGILHKLPPWLEEEEPPPPINKRNVLEILVNSSNYLLVEGQYKSTDDLKDITVQHITNNGKSPDFSESPDKAVISLKNDRGTSYGVYIKVQNELKAAYTEIRNEEAMRLTSNQYDYSEVDDLADAEKEAGKDKTNGKYIKLKAEIKAKYPMKISEAEPSDLGNI